MSAPPSSAAARPLVGIAVLVTAAQHPGCVLVGERAGSHGAKTIATPGGHLEYGEEWEECGRREIKEETNLDLSSPVRHVYTTNTVFSSAGKHYVTLFLQAAVAAESAPLTLMEPEKCKGWTWMPWTELKRQAQTGEVKVFETLATLLNDSTFNFP